MCRDQDILQVIQNEDIPKLTDLYKKDFPRTLYIYNFLNSAMKWKKRYPKDTHVTLMAPYGKWQNGTFIAIHQFHCYELYIFTLEENFDILYKMIINTQKIRWNERILIYAIYIDHYPVIKRALGKTDIIHPQEIPCSIWWMPIEEALNIEIQYPSEIHVKELTQNDASVINHHWPHKYPDSEEYLKLIIKMNGGYGAFLKSTDILVAWIMRIQIGMGTLHVIDEYKRRGYGSLITKVLTKKLAQEGIPPVASILDNNCISQSMFTKVGFMKCAEVMYIESEGI